MMVPQWARLRTRFIIERLQRLRERAEESPLQRAGARHARLRHHRFGSRVPVRARGVPGRLVPEARHVATRCPISKIAELYERVSRVSVVEELDPFIEEQVRMLGLPVDRQGGHPRRRRARPGHRLRGARAVRHARAAAAPQPGVPAGAPAARPRRRRPPTCRCVRRCSAPAAGTARCSPPCAARSSRPWATSAATCSAPTRRCWRPGQLAVHGRQHRHHGRLQRGARAQGRGRRHRRLDLLPLGHHGAHQRLLQRGRRPRADPRQPHHRHDRASGQSRHRASGPT